MWPSQVRDEVLDEAGKEGVNIEERFTFAEEIRRKIEHGQILAQEEQHDAEQEAAVVAQRIKAFRTAGEAALRDGKYFEVKSALDAALALQPDDKTFQEIQPMRDAAAAGLAAETKVAELLAKAGASLETEDFDEAQRLAQAAVDEAKWEQAIKILTDELGAARAAAHAGEMGRRLHKAGAQVGKLTASLMWDNGNDLDIHCETPAGDHIWYGAKKDGKGGELDIDQNAKEDNLTNMPIENIFFAEPQPGHYRFWVEAVDMDRASGRTPYTVRLTHNTEVREEHFDSIQEDDEIPAFEFDVLPEGEPAGETAGDAEDPNMMRLRVAEELKRHAEEMLLRAQMRRKNAESLRALRMQADIQCSAQQFAKSVATYKQALELAPDHPGVQAGLQQSEAMLLKWNTAEAKFAQAQAEFDVTIGGGRQTAAALKLVREGLKECPKSALGQSLLKMYVAAEKGSTVAIDVGDETSTATVEAVAQATAKQIILGLELGGRCSYRMFTGWWQQQLKVHDSGALISDKELQATMVIWHDHDGEGQAADAVVLARVIGEMLHKGIIRMTADGQVLPLVDPLANSGASEQIQVPRMPRRGSDVPTTQP